MNGLCDLIREVQGLRSDFQNLSPRDAGGVRHIDTAGHQNYQVHTLRGGHENSHVETQPTYRITFFEVFPEIKTLGVRLHRPDAPLIDVLACRGVILSDTPIRDIYVTLLPDLEGAGRVIRFATGNIELPNALTSGYLRPVKIEGIESPFTPDFADMSAPVAVGTVLKPERFSTIGTLTSVTTQDLFTGIAQYDYCRIHGHITALKPSSTSTGGVNVQMRRTSDDAIMMRLAQCIIPETGAPIFPFDSGWLSPDAACYWTFLINDLGVVGNQAWCSAMLDIQPFRAQ